MSTSALREHNRENALGINPIDHQRDGQNDDRNADGSHAIAPLFQASQTPVAASKFHATTIAPSPPPVTPEHDHATLSSLDTSSTWLQPALDTPTGRSSPLSAGLRIQTEMIPGCTVTTASAHNTARTSGDFSRIAPPRPSISRTPSIKNAFASSLNSNTSLSGSALSSPMLNAMVLSDVTPLPSPLMSGDSPGPWRKLMSRPPSRDVTIPSNANSALVTANGESISSAIANQSKRRAYHGLLSSANETAFNNSALGINREKNVEGHVRDRSLSEYIPEAIQVPITRHIAVSSSHAAHEATPDSSNTESAMKREPHLAVQRGLAPVIRPPTPPSSRTEGSDSDSSAAAINDMKSKYEYFDAFTVDDGKRRRWRGLKELGEGTFSKVFLATSQALEDDGIGYSDVFGSHMEGILKPDLDAKIDSQKLVAVKVCEHGPKGGASEERIEVSLNRELEIMKSIHHPSLVHLKAWNMEKTRAILVLTYCPGGDLFDVADKHKTLLIPGLVRRIFAELVGAVQYLHSAHIVHRDIKLENVLVNLSLDELAEPRDWSTYPYSVITLTDLGLSRRVTDDQKLTTRCGSDDYAAPEVILGKGYDGRATDAWSLGVLLYALLESRLPFDPDPRMTEAQRMRSRTSHRIARIDWSWIEYAGDEGEREGSSQKFKDAGLEGAMAVTEGLLSRERSRWTMDKLAEHEFVKGGISVDGGIKFRVVEKPGEVAEN